MNDNQIHTSESQLQQRCADLEKDNARLRGAIKNSACPESIRRYGLQRFPIEHGDLTCCLEYCDCWKRKALEKAQ